VLEAYDAAGTLLATFTSTPLPVGTAGTMSISRATPDISYISAYAVDGPEGFGPFTSLDYLVVNAVPEPAGFALPGLAVIALRRSRGR
jgi:hypothetical protein